MAVTMKRGEMSQRIREGLRALGPDCDLAQMRTWLQRKYSIEPNETTFYNLRTEYRGQLEREKQQAKPEVKPPVAAPKVNKPKDTSPAPPKVEDVNEVVPAVGATDRASTSRTEENDVNRTSQPSRSDLNGEHNKPVAVEPVVAPAATAQEDDDLIKASDLIDAMPQVRALLEKLGGRRKIAKQLIDAL